MGWLLSACDSAGHHLHSRSCLAVKNGALESVSKAGAQLTGGDLRCRGPFENQSPLWVEGLKTQGLVSIETFSLFTMRGSPAAPTVQVASAPCTHGFSGDIWSLGRGHRCSTKGLSGGRSSTAPGVLRSQGSMTENAGVGVVIQRGCHAVGGGRLTGAGGAGAQCCPLLGTPFPGDLNAA